MLIPFYWVLVIAGGGYFLLSFILGELLELGGIFDGIGDAIEGIFQAGETEIVLPEAGEVDLGASPFSFRTLVMFASGFGAGGLVGTGLGLSEAWTLVPAFGFGLVAGLLAWLFLRYVYGEQAENATQPSDYEGLIGRVITSIPEGRLGQVTLVVKLQKRNFPARSEDGSAIANQTQVQIVSMEGGTLIVRSLE